MSVCAAGSRLCQCSVEVGCDGASRFVVERVGGEGKGELSFLVQSSRRHGRRKCEASLRCLLKILSLAEKEIVYEHFCLGNSRFQKKPDV